MATVKKLLESYERTGSYRQTAREMRVSHNTVRKYVLRAQAAREGMIEEIVPRDREIRQPGRVVTPEVRDRIHRILEKNRKKPKKQRCNAKLIWHYLLASGYSLSYSTVKREVAGGAKNRATVKCSLRRRPMKDNVPNLISGKSNSRSTTFPNRPPRLHSYSTIRCTDLPASPLAKP